MQESLGLPTKMERDEINFYESLEFLGYFCKLCWNHIFIWIKFHKLRKIKFFICEFNFMIYINFSFTLGFNFKNSKKFREIHKILFPRKCLPLRYNKYIDYKKQCFLNLNNCSSLTWSLKKWVIPAFVWKYINISENNYQFEINNRNTRIRWEWSMFKFST